MAVPEQIPVVNYVADGVVKKFDVPFEYDQQSDLHIYVDGAEPTIDKYFFDDNAFNFYIAPTSGQDVKIKRITPKERDTDYNLHTNTVRPKALNTDFDRLWYVLQEVFSDVGGLSQAVQDEIIARIQGDEELLNQLTAEISARMLGDDAITEDLKNYIDNMIALIIGDPSFNGINADKVNDASGETQQQVNYNGGSKWHSRVSGYNRNEHAVLTNGDIVKSTIDGNTNDPNVDMTGWVEVNSASQIFDASGKTQQEINDYLNTASPYSANNYATIQAAVNNSALGNTVEVNTGTYSQSVDLPKVNLQGKGYGTEISVPSNSYGVKSLQTTAWDRMKVSNVAFLGESLVGTVGFEFDPSNPLAGRRNLEYCTFKNLDVGIYKPTGNIGNKYTSCSFTGNNYGYRAKSATTMVMHSGCDTFDDCQFDGTNTWAIDLTNTTDGFGQFAIENSIFQFSVGGGVRLDLGNIIPVCPPVIRNTWFESVATSTSVDRDGVAETPREIKLINTPMCIIEGCYLTNVELINSTAIAKHCRIDNATTFPQFYIDNNSQFIVEDLYANGFVPPTIQVKSIAKQAREIPSALTMRGYDIAGITKRPPNAFSAIGLPYSGTVGVTTWSIVGTETRTASCVVDDGITGTCAELELQAGIINVIGNTTLTAGKWAVWGVSLKPVYGTGVAGIFKFKNVDYDIGDLYISEGSWSHNFGVAKVGTGGSVACWFEPSASGGKMRISNYFVVQFNTEKEAIAFANSRLAVNTN